MPAETIDAMRDDDWRSLTSAIENGTCILMLGPDAFTVEVDGETLPLAVALARWVLDEKLRDRLGPDDIGVDPAKPWTVAQVAIAKEDAYTVRSWAKDFYDSHDTVSEELQTLASLPFELVISTSPALTAERAFRDAKPDTHGDFYDYTAPARTGMPDPTRRAPVVYNLFGSLKNTESMLLSDHERFEYLVSVIKENPPLPEKLLSRLRDRKQSFLFVGFDLMQWQLRMLIHVLANNTQRTYKSFALELDEAAVDGETRMFYTAGHKVHFVDMDIPTFAAGLRARVPQELDATTATTESAPAQEAGVAPRPPAPVLDPGAPTVFVCHAHEDAAFAARVSEGLQANRINVWLDKEALGGGDAWNDVIEDRIRHDVNYCVVLQSVHLLHKTQGYVNKEINLALDRQLEYRKPRVFLIPAIIDAAQNALRELENLQSVDLTGADGVDQLVRVIRRDMDLASRQG
jgi:hypothetical protein